MKSCAIDDKILFLLPIVDNTTTCSIFGPCPENLLRRLEAAGIRVVPLPQPSPSGVGAVSEMIDMLLFFQIPKRGQEIRCLLDRVAPWCSDGSTIVIFGCGGRTAHLTLWMRVRHLVQTFSFVRKGRGLARELGATSVSLLSVVPSFDAPGVLLDFHDSRQINFVRETFFNFIRGKSLLARLLIRILIESGCINYFIGSPVVIGAKDA